MSKSQAYIQFPLCLLRFDRSPRERLDLALDLAYRTLGKKLLATSSSEERRHLVEQAFEKGKNVKGFDRGNPLHVQLVVGAKRLGIIYYGITYTESQLRHFDTFHDNFTRKYGRDATVRIRQDLVLEARDGSGMSYDELAVLAAIYSVIGRRRVPVRICLDMIRRRAVGCRNAAIERAEYPPQPAGAPSESTAVQCDNSTTPPEKPHDTVPMTRAKLRRLVGTLHQRGFFARFTFGKRITYFGLGQTEVEFQQAILNRLVKRSVFEANARRKEQELNREIYRRRAEANASFAPSTPASRPIVPNQLPPPKPPSVARL